MKTKGVIISFLVLIEEVHNTLEVVILSVIICLEGVVKETFDHFIFFDVWEQGLHVVIII